MIKKKRERSFTIVGGSSLLMIFAVLCMTMLALLALSSAQAGSRLSEASAEAVAGYYEAYREAQDILAKLRCGTLPDGVTKNENLYSFTCAISDRQALEVEVTLSGGEYKILRMQSVSTVEWTADEKLDLWNGEF